METDTLTAAQERLLGRFNAQLPGIKARALGQQLRVRIDKNTLHVGVIVDVEPGFFSDTIRGVSLNFKVTIECGANKARKSFFLNKIPQ